MGDAINLDVVRSGVKYALEHLERGRGLQAKHVLLDMKEYLTPIKDDTQSVWTEVSDSREINLRVITNHEVIVHFTEGEPAQVIAVNGDRLYLKRGDRFWWYDYKSKKVRKVVYR